MRDKQGKFLKGFSHNKGVKRNQAFRDMRRKMQTGKKLSAETKKKMSESAKGKVRSKEFRKNISKAKLGNKNGMFGKKWTEKTRKIQRDQRLGEKNHNWKGGLTPVNRRIRTSLDYRLWRETVFKRDESKCRKCGNSKLKLHPHHIQNFSQFPELRFAIDNGITFCEKHHKEFHKIYGNKNNTKEQLIEFLTEGDSIDQAVYDSVKKKEDFKINLYAK